MGMMTPIRALVLDVLRQVTKTVEQDCSDEQLASAIQIVMPGVAFGGGINPCDYCNADKAKKAKDNNGSDKGKRQPHARASG